MCDAFESMMIDLKKQDNKLEIINKKPYWEFNKKTIRDFLNNTNRDDIWEHIEDYRDRPTQHPNIEGYKLISDILYDFIVDLYY
jgi:hypothetical protein